MVVTPSNCTEHETKGVSTYVLHCHAHHIVQSTSVKSTEYIRTENRVHQHTAHSTEHRAHSTQYTAKNAHLRLSARLLAFLLVGNPAPVDQDGPAAQCEGDMDIDAHTHCGE